jgi:AbrB family looped-hinge helix DNA binding protein
MFYGTTVTIDAAGRLVVPKSIREAAGLRPGMPLAISFRDGRIEIEPAPLEVRVVKRRGFRIAEPAAPVEELDQEAIRRTRDEGRPRRKHR